MEAITKIKLIRDFFAPVSMDEMKKLTPDDRTQLASAIARENGITQEMITASNPIASNWQLIAY